MVNLAQCREEMLQLTKLFGIMSCNEIKTIVLISSPIFKQFKAFVLFNSLTIFVSDQKVVVSIS